MRGDAQRAALAGLHAFLEEDGAFTGLLERLEHRVHRRLRFARVARDERLEAVWAFLETASQLHHCHCFFQRKLRCLADNGVKNGDALEAADCVRLVDALDDLLGVCRVLYGRQLVASAAIRSAFDAAASTGDTSRAENSESVSSTILSEFLRSEQTTPEALAGSALARFSAVIEFVEALSKALQDYETGGADCSSEAPRLLHIAQENKHFVHLVQIEAREEQELIALQSQFGGARAPEFRDLVARKLILQVDVQVSAYGASVQDDAREQRSLHAHCFQDGCLVLSERVDGGQFSIQDVLRLRDDAVFLELVPDLVAEQRKMLLGAFVLITEGDSRAFSIQDDAAWQQWLDAISGFLVSNDARSSTLASERAKEAPELPSDVQRSVNDGHSLLAQFTSFHDDPLPGVFWLSSSGLEAATADWQLVEVILVAERWLMVFCLDGWKKHSHVLHLDMAQPGAAINEDHSGDKEWSLVVSSGDSAGTSVRLVSKKRTRIDFWFDQVAKVIAGHQAAVERAARADRKKKSPKAASTDGFINARAKKRRANTVIVGGEPAASIAANVSGEPQAATTARGSKRSHSDRSLVDEKAATEAPDAPSRGGKRRKKPVLAEVEDRVQGEVEDQVQAEPKEQAKSTTDDAAVIASTAKTSTPAPAVAPATPKNPKRRWVKRKSEGPQDSALITTPTSHQPGNGAKQSTGDDTSIAYPSPPASAKTTEKKPAAVAESAAPAVRIILTGIEASPAVRKKIRSIASAEYEEDIERATHVVAPKDTLKRTVKLLCGISRCAHVLDERWLDESARVGTAVYERTHCLKDAKAEAKWHFDLKKTMYDFTPAQRSGLFAGRTVFITNHKSILPPVKDLVKIVECAGGKATTKGSAGPSDLVITSEAAVGVASVQKALASANPERIYSPELVLSSILQQHVDLDQHRVSLPKAGPTSRRRK